MDEIMNYDEMGMETEIEEVEGGNSGIGTGKAIAIGVGVIAASVAAFKLIKKAWAKHKANKELHQPDGDEPVEVTDEQIEEITK